MKIRSIFLLCSLPFLAMGLASAACADDIEACSAWCLGDIWPRWCLGKCTISNTHAICYNGDCFFDREAFCMGWSQSGGTDSIVITCRASWEPFPYLIAEEPAESGCDPFSLRKGRTATFANPSWMIIDRLGDPQNPEPAVFTSADLSRLQKTPGWTSSILDSAERLVGRGRLAKDKNRIWSIVPPDGYRTTSVEILPADRQVDFQTSSFALLQAQMIGNTVESVVALADPAGISERVIELLETATFQQQDENAETMVLVMISLENGKIETVGNTAFTAWPQETDE